MTDFFKRNQSELIFWPMILAIFFASRLINLGLIPIFTDEAIYLRWSQIMAYDASLRYLPLVDGKPPLFMWLTSVLMRTLSHLDPLIVGRLVSVFSGFGALIGIYFLSWVMFRNRTIARLSALFYLLVPFTFFYDRFALADSLLTMWGIWALSLTILLVKTVRLDVALILGGIIGFGLLTKTPAVFFYGFLPLSLLLFDWKKPRWKVTLVKWLGLVLISLAISQLFYSVLRLFPLFNMISQKNSEFILTPKEFLRHPFELLFNNISSLLRWEQSYLTLTVSLLAITSSILAILRRSLTPLVLLLAAVGQLLVMATFNSSIFPRYLLPLTPPILVLSAWGFFELAKGKVWLKKWLWLIAFVLLILPAIVDFQLITDPPHAQIADGDSRQYINAWPAGYGVNQIRRFLAVQSQQYAKVTVGTEGTFGLMPYALQLYQKEYPNVEIKDYWPLPDKVPPELAFDIKNHPTYFIIYQRQTDPANWKMTPLASFQQGISSDHLRLYRLLSGN